MSNNGILVGGLALFLSSCGAYGVRHSMPPDPIGLESSTSEEERRSTYAAHPEFRNQYGLGQVNAHFAYARGATGEGVTLGIVDSGVDPSHLKFNGKLEWSNIGGYDPDFDTCHYRAPDGTCLSLIGHGTFVAGIMAASRRTTLDASSEGALAIHGVAFDADVISVGFPDMGEILDDILGENPTPEQILSFPDLLLDIESYLEKQFASVFGQLNGRVPAVNASFGLPENIEDFDAEALRRRFPNVIEAIAQADMPAYERTVYVWAAGNSHGEINLDGSVVSASSVDVVAGLPVWIPELRGHSLAVVATDRQGRIADFSSRCGIAKEFCLAAPGVDIVGPVPSFYCTDGTAECYLSVEGAGTSSAAPFVTGGIGLLVQYYRNQLGNDEIVKRILATADKTGVYADSDVYGQGFLDLDTATRPVGETRMLTGRSLSGSSAPSVASVFHLGRAFGDSLVRGLASREVASFDELDAPFFRPLGDFLRSNVSASSPLVERLRTLGHDPRVASWRMADTKLRLRLDAALEPHGATGAGGVAFPIEKNHSDGDDWRVPVSIGFLSLTHSMASGEVWFGYRSHPSWQFGLHIDDDTAKRGIGLVEPGTFTDDGAYANPFASLARNGVSIGFAPDAALNGFRIAAFQGSAQYGERRDPIAGEAIGFLTEYRVDEPSESGLALQVGWLAEDRGLLGGKTSGAFGEMGSKTGIVGLSAHRYLDHGWSLLASAHAGLSRTGIRGYSMVRELSALISGSYSVGLVGDDVDRAGGYLAFRVSQPLRVEAGRATLRWVSGRTPGGQVAVDQSIVNLEPPGRQLDLDLTYSRPWAGGEAHLAAIASRDIGHLRGEREVAMLVRYSRSF